MHGVSIHGFFDLSAIEPISAFFFMGFGEMMKIGVYLTRPMLEE